MTYQITIEIGPRGILEMLDYRNRLEGLLPSEELVVDYLRVYKDKGFIITSPHLEKCIKVLVDDFEIEGFHIKVLP
jgi:hypothetical protein